jgi:hypothetical protein
MIQKGIIAQASCTITALHDLPKVYRAQKNAPA